MDIRSAQVRDAAGAFLRRRVRVMGYDAFVSYSHAADGRLAPALQLGLQRLARPWYRPRASAIFRDETGLAVSPHLWASIVRALDDSEWFVVLCSPEAAGSEWVEREIDHWLAHRRADRILLVLTDGDLVWDRSRGDFDPARSTGLPPALLGHFDDEPRHLDLRWARGEEQLDVRHVRFRAAVAELAAPIRNMARDELEAEDVRQHRRSMRLARGATTVLVLLLAIALSATLVAVQQRGDAQRAGRAAQRTAESLRLEAQSLLGEKLAAQSINVSHEGQTDLALLLATEANRLESSAFTKSALLGALTADWTLVRQLRGLSSDTTSASFSPDGRILAVGDQHGGAALWNVVSGRRLASLQGLDPHAPMVALRFSTDGKDLFAVRRTNTSAGSLGSVGMWDVATGRLLRVLDSGSDVFQVATGAARAVLAAVHPTYVRLWNLDTGKLLRDVNVGPLAAAALSPDGSLLAAANIPSTPFGSDNVESVRVWRVATGQPVGTQCGSAVGPGFDSPGMVYSGPPQIFGLAFDADTTVRSELSGGRYAVTASCAIGTGQTHTTRVDVHTTGDTPVVGISPDGRTLAARNLADGSITVFDGATGQAIGTPRPSMRAGDPSYDEIPVVFSPDGTLIVGVDDAKGEVKIWRSRPTAPLLATEQRVSNAQSLSPSGHLIATADGQVSDTRTNRVLVQTHSTDVAFSVDDRYVAAVETTPASATSISIWDLATHQTSPPKPIRHDLPQTCNSRSVLGFLEFSPDARLLATFCSDTRVALIDVASARVLSITQTSVIPEFAAFTLDGRLLAVATGIHCCRAFQLFDVSNDQLHPGQVFNNPVLYGPMAASDRAIAIATGAGILLMSADAQHPQQTLLSEPGSPATGPVAFSPDGSILAAAANDGLQLWDLHTDTLLGTMPGAPDLAWRLTFTPNGQGVTSLNNPTFTNTAAASPAVIVHWDLDLTAWDNRACDAANRNLTRAEWTQYLPTIPYHKTCPDIP